MIQKRESGFWVQFTEEVRVGDPAEAVNRHPKAKSALSSAGVWFRPPPLIGSAMTLPDLRPARHRAAPKMFPRDTPVRSPVVFRGWTWIVG